MRPTLPHPERDSYLKHRQQRLWQIIVPVILAALVFVAFAVLVTVSAARGTGDVEQWGAAAAVMILLPLLVMSLVFILVLSGFAYLMGRLLGILPVYTGRLQELVYRIAAYIKRFTDLLVKPVFGLSEVSATLKALVGRR
ncbi:MAG: hypothetical protein ACM3QS_00875 [Bacteroidota bacterium]